MNYLKERNFLVCCIKNFKSGRNKTKVVRLISKITSNWLKTFTLRYCLHSCILQLIYTLNNAAQ